MTFPFILRRVRETLTKRLNGVVGSMLIGLRGYLSRFLFFRWLGHLRSGMQYWYGVGYTWSNVSKAWEWWGWSLPYSLHTLCYCAWNLGRLRRSWQSFVSRHWGLSWLALLSLTALGFLLFISTGHYQGNGTEGVLRKVNLLFFIPLIILWRSK